MVAQDLIPGQRVTQQRLLAQREVPMEALDLIQDLKVHRMLLQGPDLKEEAEATALHRVVLLLILTLETRPAAFPGASLPPRPLRVLEVVTGLEKGLEPPVPVKPRPLVLEAT
uniref:Uncharacterized protein n=1 Tax=Graphocephala atropunctata TaxID=36148 RepID=A0A1B6L2V2_9HEMI